MSQVVIVNNKIHQADINQLSVNDRGFTLGHGCFETIRCYNGKIPLLEHHWSRIIKSCKLLSIDLKISISGFKKNIDKILNLNKLSVKDAVVRVTVSHGVSARGILPESNNEPTVVFTANEFRPIYNQPLKCVIVNTRRNEGSLSSRIKSVSYLDNILATMEARAQNADEAILLNNNGNLAEGAISNIFLILKSKLLTPRIEDGALPGITRNIILEHLRLPIKTIEAEITVEQLFNAEAIFATNSLCGVRPIFNIGTSIYDTNHPILEIVANHYKIYIQNKLNLI